MRYPLLFAIILKTGFCALRRVSAIAIEERSFFGESPLELVKYPVNLVSKEFHTETLICASAVVRKIQRFIGVSLKIIIFKD